MLWTIIIIIALFVLIIGSYTDITSLEIPDLVSGGLIIAGFGVRILYSLIFWDFWVFLEGVVGFILCLIIGFALYDLGVWGGGDSKLLFGLGILLGYSLSVSILNNFLLSFLTNLLILGFFYEFIILFFRKIFIKGAILSDGVPFVPAFLISFLFTLCFGNVIFL